MGELDKEYYKAKHYMKEIQKDYFEVLGKL